MSSEQSTKRKLSIQERIAIIVLIPLLFLFGFLMTGDDAFDRLFEAITGNGGRNLLAIGSIENIQNNARLKLNNSETWDSAAKDQRIHDGDSVFTGTGSKAKVVLDDGNTLEIDAESLVVFRKTKDSVLPTLDSGNFTLKINKPMKVMIDGKQVTIDGTGEMKISQKDGKTELTLVKGNITTMVDGNAPMVLSERKQAAMDDGKLQPKGDAAPVLVPRALAQQIDHVWKVEELYNISRGQAIPRDPFPITAHERVALSWEETPAVDRVMVQISRSANFDQGLLQETGSFGSATLTEVYPGDNFWRVSHDGKTWSAAERFFVKTRYIEKTIEVFPPRPMASKDPRLFNYEMRIQNPKGLRAYIVEVEKVDASGPNARNSFMASTPLIQLQLPAAGKYVVRARGINEQEELTQWSRAFPVEVVEPPKPVLAKTSPTPDPAKRSPSQVAESTAKLDRIREHLNALFSSSMWEVEGGAFSMFSTKQEKSGALAPQLASIGVRFRHWMGQHLGFEGFFKTKMLGFNETGSAMSPMFVEGRTHYRMTLPSPLRAVREFHVGPFLGYEVYSNSGAKDFEVAYNLMKVGLDIEFPVGEKWDTGGEVVMGQGAGTTKSEVSGHIHYYYRKDVSIGSGYRVYLLETALPSGRGKGREGYGELYSVIRFHY